MNDCNRCVSLYVTFWVWYAQQKWGPDEAIRRLAPLAERWGVTISVNGGK